MFKRYVYADEMFHAAIKIDDSDKKAEYLRNVNENLMKNIAQAVCNTDFYPVDIKNYKFCDEIEPWSTLQSEIRYLYLFTKGNAIADKLSVEKRNDLAKQCLERLSEGEAKIFAGILKQNLYKIGISKTFLETHFLEKENERRK